MKGVVFNLLEECVSEDFGDDVWDQMLDSAGLDGVYTSLGNYPDADLMALAGSAAELLKLEVDAVVRWFGKAAMPHFHARYPALFAPHKNTRDFVLTLNDVIHPEVRKLYPGIDVPEFGFNTQDPDELVMTYYSARQMCSFAEGLIDGAAGIYSEQAEITQSECMKHGAERCVLRLRFTPADG